MKPNEYYTRMVSSITRADVRLVAACMTEHVGQENAVKLSLLAARVSTDTRKVREILAQLTVRYGWPIGAISGKTGRWIIANEAERELVIADLGSRIKETQARVKALQNIKLAPEAPKEVKAVQPPMFDVEQPVNRLAYWNR